MYIYGLQLDLVWEDPQENFAAVECWWKRRTPEPGSMVVLPEMFSTGFSMQADRIAQPPYGATETWLQDLAQRSKITLIGGVTARHPGDDRAANEAVAYAPDANQLCRYRKFHPFSFAGEDRYFLPGSKLETFLWNGFKVAPVICYDLRFPELFRHLARVGTEIFLVLANWPATRAAHWRTLLAARAVENQAYVVGVNRCGDDPKLHYSGYSQMYGPDGTLLACAGTRPGWVHSLPDRESLVEYRRRFPFLEDARADLLTEIP